MAQLQRIKKRAQRLSIKSALLRIGFNVYPVHYFSGCKVTQLKPHLRTATIEIKRNWRTKGLLGNIYGGLMYSALDALPMGMLIKAMGKDYVCWDKAGSIKYLKPAYCKKLICQVHFTHAFLSDVRYQVDINDKHVVKVELELRDEEGTLYALVSKDVHVEKRTAYEARKQHQQKKSLLV